MKDTDRRGNGSDDHGYHVRAAQVIVKVGVGLFLPYPESSSC